MQYPAGSVVGIVDTVAQLESAIETMVSLVHAAQAEPTVHLAWIAGVIDPARRRLYSWPYWSCATSMLPLLACRASTRAA